MRSLTTILLVMLYSSLQAQTKSHPNVVVILADQLRADRLHCYGNPRATSPNIDNLAASGVRIQHFYANAPWTAPSQSTLSTSLYPSRHGKTLLDFTPVIQFPPEAVTLAENFRAGGYGTAAFINNSVAGKYLLGRGFDTFDQYDGGGKDPAALPAAVNTRILQWVDSNRTQPFFVYIDYWQPHYPYAPPPEHDIFKANAYPAECIAGYGSKVQDLFRWTSTGDSLALQRVVQLYDGYIHYIDQYIGELVQSLKDRGLYDNTIFLVTSDHGELLYSHVNDFTTADHRSLYDAALTVPAIYFGAGVPHNRVLQGLASHINTAPTLLEMAGLNPNPSAQGRSLAAAIQGIADDTNEEYVFSESDLEIQQRSVRNARYKLILNVETAQTQLFDTTADPAEQNDIAALSPDVVQELQAVLDQWRSANEPSVDELYRRWGTLSALTPKETIDDNATTIRLSGGGWSIVSQPASMANPRFWAAPLSFDQHLRSITWRTNNPKIGRYRISMKNGTPTGVPIATNAPVIVQTRTDTFNLTADLTLGQSVWQELGTFDDPRSVTLTNDADGWIVAGAVMFERVQ